MARPVHEEMRMAVAAIREHLGAVEATLHASGSPGETGRALINLAPYLVDLGAALKRLEAQVDGRSE
jgi:hypothetical protein